MFCTLRRKEGEGNNVITRITLLWRSTGASLDSPSLLGVRGPQHQPLQNLPYWKEWKLQLWSTSRSQSQLSFLLQLRRELTPGSPYHWKAAAHWSESKEALHPSITMWSWWPHCYLLPHVLTAARSLPENLRTAVIGVKDTWILSNCLQHSQNAIIFDSLMLNTIV